MTIDAQGYVLHAKHIHDRDEYIKFADDAIPTLAAEIERLQVRILMLKDLLDTVAPGWRNVVGEE